MSHCSWKSWLFPSYGPITKATCSLSSRWATCNPRLLLPFLWFGIPGLFSPVRYTCILIADTLKVTFPTGKKIAQTIRQSSKEGGENHTTGVSVRSTSVWDVQVACLRAAYDPKIPTWFTTHCHTPAADHPHPDEVLRRPFCWVQHFGILCKPF